MECPISTGFSGRVGFKKPAIAEMLVKGGPETFALPG
jgi:hypothetical protein